MIDSILAAVLGLVLLVAVMTVVEYGGKLVGP